jgi:hypothetical protein
LIRFAEELSRLRTLAGNPSLKNLVVVTADLEHPLARSTVSDKLTAKSVPDWDFVVSFVTGCQRYATSTGVPLAADLVDLARWEEAHWRMLSALDGARGEDRLAAAARAEIVRHGERGGAPSPELAALAGILDELRGGADGTVVISVIGGAAAISKAAVLVLSAQQAADEAKQKKHHP